MTTSLVPVNCSTMLRRKPMLVHSFADPASMVVHRGSELIVAAKLGI